MTHLTDDTLQGLVDGALASVDAEVAAEHLARCEACGEHYKAYLALTGALMATQTLTVSEGFTEEVMQRVEEKVRLVRIAQEVTSWGRYEAAVVLLVSMLLGIGSMSYVFRGPIAEWSAAVVQGAAAQTEVELGWAKPISDAVYRIGDAARWPAEHLILGLRESTLLVTAFFIVSVLMVLLFEALGGKVPRGLWHPLIV